jgi:hypothetical protein
VEDGVATSLQFDPRARVLYVMGSFKRLTKDNVKCDGLAAYVRAKRAQESARENEAGCASERKGESERPVCGRSGLRGGLSGGAAG